jgi:hypothetical protein
MPRLTASEEWRKFKRPAFRIRERGNIDAKGTCERGSSEDDEPREIEISRGLGQRMRLWTLAHEALHLADRDDKHVMVPCSLDRLAYYVQEVLWRDGWRRR